MDPSDNNKMYLIGMFKSNGAVIGLQRSDAKQNFLTTFAKLETVVAYTAPTDSSHLFGCGYWSTSKSAGVFRMKTDGTLTFFKQIVNYQEATQAVPKSVQCYGIVYDASQSQVTILLATN